MSRLDWQVKALTYLRVEVSAAVYYGTLGGEFRLELDVPEDIVQAIPGASGFQRVPNPLFDVGVGIRIDL